jgi:hypothetical protein
VLFVLEPKWLPTFVSSGILAGWKCHPKNKSRTIVAPRQALLNCTRFFAALQGSIGKRQRKLQ